MTCTPTPGPVRTCSLTRGERALLAAVASLVLALVLRSAWDELRPGEAETVGELASALDRS